MKINFHLLKLLQNNLKNRFSPNAKEISKWTKRAARESLNQADSFSIRFARTPGWHALTTGLTLYGIYAMTGTGTVIDWGQYGNKQVNEPLANLEDNQISDETSNEEEKIRKIAKEEFKKLLNEEKTETKKETLDANSGSDKRVFYDDEEYENLNDSSAGDIDAFGRIFHRIGDYLSNPTAKDETPLPQAPTQPPERVEKIPKAPTRPPSPPTTKRGKVRIRLQKTP